MSNEREHGMTPRLQNIFERMIASMASGAIAGILTGVITLFLTGDITISFWAGIAGLVIVFVLYLVARLWGPIQQPLLHIEWLIINNWQLLLGSVLVVVVACGAFALLNNLWALVLVIVLTFAVMLLTRNYPQLPSRRRVALQTWCEKYVRAVDGGRSVIDGKGEGIDRWEQFELASIGSGKVTLRTWLGQYVRVDRETSQLVAPSRSWSIYAVFELVEVEGDKVALRGYNKRYVSAGGEDSGNCSITRGKLGNRP